MDINQIIKAIEEKSNQYDAIEKDLLQKGDIKEALHIVSKKTGLWEALIIVQNLNKLN